MFKIVISYRRRDSEAISGRIHDRLVKAFGPNSIFMDIDSIPVGVNFRDYIANALRQTDMLLVIIGPHWLGAQKRKSRIQNTTDPVRIELEKATELGIPIWPVLVDDAVMPGPDDLPESIQSLSDQNAAIVDAGRDFHTHMDRLVRDMNNYLSAHKKIDSYKERLSKFLLAFRNGNFDGRTKRYTIAAIFGLVVVTCAVWAAYFRSIPIGLSIEPSPTTVAPMGCDQEKTSHSPAMPTNQANLTFANNSNEVKQIYWLNQIGARVLYVTLNLNQSASFQTYMEHPWIVTDATGKCQAIYMPTPWAQFIKLTK